MKARSSLGVLAGAVAALGAGIDAPTIGSISSGKFEQRRPRKYKSGGFKTPWRGGHSGGTLVRKGSQTDQVRDVLLLEFKRCGFKPKSIKVVEVRREGAEPNERGAFYLNIGYLRGLDPDEVYRTLRATQLDGAGNGKIVRRFPDQCGQRKVFEALARLEQRVERPPAMMAESFSDLASGRTGDLEKAAP